MAIFIFGHWNQPHELLLHSYACINAWSVVCDISMYQSSLWDAFPIWQMFSMLSSLDKTHIVFHKLQKLTRFSFPYYTALYAQW